MFSKVLVANRGEIAVRIIRACREMGIATVAVYSEADRNALHTAMADESICIGPASARDSYLNEERIVSAALATKANAIHPGYGFLSENAHFARLCRENGIAFIGPSADEMERLSDKTGMKRLAEEAGLHTIPGTAPLASLDEALEAADRIGYPVMLKARSGGGGRGIRLARDSAELTASFANAVAEAEAAFGDGAVYLEKFISPAHHIEVQILADEEGTVMALGERDCSIQQHHQKLVEESPSPAVSKEQRRRLLADVEIAVRKIGYTGAGTLEFLMDESGNFWFMEMNVRLQVEHGVTEILTGIDLVKWQIRIAAGVPIGFTHDDIRLSGCAIECRINALSAGRVGQVHIPSGPFVRFDTFLEDGTDITPYYDSLLGKLIVYSRNREGAVRKLRAYLCELVVEDVATNMAQQLEIISDPRFTSGHYDTGFAIKEKKENA